MLFPAHRRLVLVVFAALSAGPLSAQIILSGNVSDGSGGPLLTGQVYHTTGFSVPATTTLTIQPGAILKIDGGTISIQGTLDVAGTSVAPAHITSIFDDSVGGDSNGDGPSSGSPGDWGTIQVNATAQIDHALIRYGGSFTAAIEFAQGSLTLTNSTVSDALNEAIDLNASTLIPAISNCALDDNGTLPIRRARLSQIEGLSNNTAAGNGTGDYALVTSVGVATDVNIEASNLIGGVLVLSTQSTSVQAGSTVSFGPGVVVKWATNAMFNAFGTIRTRGTRDDPVVFTSMADDEHGGDTNGDGPSTGMPGDWWGFRAANGGTLDFDHALLRFGGGFGDRPTIENSIGNIVLTHSTIEHSANAALRMTNSFSPPTVRRCSFVDNETYPVDAMKLLDLAGFLYNQASGHGTSDAMKVTSSTVSADLVIGPKNFTAGALIIRVNTFVNAGNTLTLERGTVIKIENGFGMSSTGGLVVEGTAFEPVVLTSLADDDWAGDTNKDGPSSGTPGTWFGLGIFASATPSDIEHLIVRYPTAGIACSSGTAAMRSIRAEHCTGDGIRVTAHSGDAENWVAFDCGQDGIEIVNGSYDLLHATSTGNATGIRRAAHTGQAINTISWGNTTNYIGFLAGDLVNSNGSAALAGMNGNIDTDPFFVDASVSAGDLRLQAGSLCVDTGQTAAAVTAIKDFDEHSRLLDPTLSGTLLADMGAHERYVWNMTIAGRPRIGGGFKATVDGPAGTSLYLLGALDGAWLDDPFGIVSCGVNGVVKIGVAPVGTPFPVAIPFEPALIGTPFGLQTRTLPTGSTTEGAITNLYRDTIEFGRQRGKRKKIRFTDKPLGNAPKQTVP